MAQADVPMVGRMLVILKVATPSSKFIVCSSL